jgi:asparagine synthase (glutamine-hydrolysing)
VRFLDADLASIAADRGQTAAWTVAFGRYGVRAPLHVRGDFAVAVQDDAGRVLLAVDRFAIRTLCYRLDNGELRYAQRADELGSSARDLDPQALYDYLYSHVIPAPRTVFRGVYRLPAGHCALFENGKLAVTRWWTPVFDEVRSASFSSLRDEFRELLRESIGERAAGARVGCFLSGGTDSSTVAGTLASVTGMRPATFSIGFDAQGYDEIGYARIAARHFNTNHHEYYVTPDDLVRSIPDIAAFCDQPFGNSSILPTYYCARMAREHGIQSLLAGDGGDELFGGNVRYARQRVFAIYDRVPAVVRGLIEPMLVGRDGTSDPSILRKARSYVEQARMPMPDRMQTYNLLARVGVREVMTSEFLASVDPDLPLREERDVYAGCAENSSMVNRMLWFDWRYTLADNDLRKVTMATSLAGVAAAFPLLDDRVVDFSLRLPTSYKLNGLKLRWFFKEALRGFLPDATITKRKQGFGLPFGVWMLQNDKLRAIALESLEALRDRGIVRPEFLDRLATEYLRHHPGYYGELVWILMMLGQWTAASGHRFPR